MELTKEQYEELEKLNNRLSHLLKDRDRLQNNKAWQQAIKIILTTMKGYE